MIRITSNVVLHQVFFSSQFGREPSERLQGGRYFERWRRACDRVESWRFVWSELWMAVA